MYQISDYARMAGDRHRLGAYFRALEGTVREGDVVLDLGTGTGLFAMRAAQLGARMVYAIDSNPVVRVAEKIAQQNGLAEKVQFIEADSLEVELPEKVDVIVSDMRGVLPFYSTHLPAIIDARRRFLRPGGRLIPARDHLYGALVDAPVAYAKFTECWRGLPFDLSAAESMRLNSWERAPLGRDQVVSGPAHWRTLEYSNLESCDAQGEMRFETGAGSLVHGLAVWYVADLAKNVSFSTAPGEPETVSGTAFFPFLRSLELKAEDAIEMVFHAKLANREYIFAWKTKVIERSGTVRDAFEQCTLGGDFF